MGHFHPPHSQLNPWFSVAVIVGLLSISWGALAELDSPLSGRLRQLDHVEGTFQQTRSINVLSVPLNSHGTFTFDRDEGVTWRTLEPVKNLVRIDPQRGVMAGESADDLTLVTSSQVVAEIFLGLFSGNLDRLEALFAIAEQPVKAGWSLRLEPKVPTVADQIAAIEVAGDTYVEKVIMEEPNGDRSEITLQVTAAE